MTQLLELIRLQVDPDEFVDVLEIDTDTLVDVFEYKVLMNSEKFDYLMGDEYE